MHGNGPPGPLFHSGAQGVDDLMYFPCRPNRSDWVVLVNLGHPKEGHHGTTGISCCAPAVRERPIADPRNRKALWAQTIPKGFRSPEERAQDFSTVDSHFSAYFREGIQGTGITFPPTFRAPLSVACDLHLHPICCQVPFEDGRWRCPCQMVSAETHGGLSPKPTFIQRSRISSRE